MFKILNLLKQIKQLLASNQTLTPNQRVKYMKKVDMFMDKFRTMPNLDTRSNKLAVSILDRGITLQTELRKNTNRTQLSYKVSYYLRYLAAAYDDLNNGKVVMDKYIKTHMFLSAVFIGIAFQVTGPILSIVFMGMMVAALYFMKKRRRTGWILGILSIPVALVVCFTYFISFVQVLPTLQATAAANAQAMGVSPTMALALVLVPTIFSVVLFGLCLLATSLGIKCRTMFI